MKVKLRLPQDYHIQPWKNGLGVTAEIAVDDGKPYRWRISSATLAVDGPFSEFPGYDRVLIVLDGGPIALAHGAGQAIHIAPLEVHRFRGDDPTVMTVTRPGHDLNIFSLRGAAEVECEIVHVPAGSEIRRPLSCGENLFYGGNGGEVFAHVEAVKEAAVITSGSSLHVTVAPSDGAPNCRLYSPTGGLVIFIAIQINN